MNKQGYTKLKLLISMGFIGGAIISIGTIVAGIIVIGHFISKYW